MKLYSFIFEDISSTKEYGLFVKSMGHVVRFYLYDIGKFRNILKVEDKFPSSEILRRCFLSFVHIKPTGGDHGNCSDSWQTVLTARSDGDESKGMGQEIYRLASAFMNKPITSDKSGSSSLAAKKMWQKIKNSPDFKGTGEFDHFIGDTFKQYLTRTNDNDLDPSFSSISSPKTEDESDDCVVLQPFNVNGAFQGYQAINKRNLMEYLENNKKLIEFLESEYGVKEQKLYSWLADAASAAFGKGYSS